MSVANDALKSVHVVPETKSPVSVSHLEFRPAVPYKEETKQGKPGTRLTLPSLMYAFVLFTFLILGVLLLRTINHHIQVKAAAAQSGVVSGSDAPTPVTPKSTGTIPAPSAVSTATLSPAPATASAPGAFPTQTEPPKPAPYKLQAVFYNPANPAAMVGGKTVFIGDHVGLYRVKSITTDTVTLESGDQTKVLKLH